MEPHKVNLPRRVAHYYWRMREIVGSVSSRLRIAKLRDLHDALSLFWPGPQPRWARVVDEKLARLEGRIAYRVRRFERRRIYQQISSVLGGELPASEIQRIIREMYKFGWRSGEVAWLKRFSIHDPGVLRSIDQIQIDGLDHLHRALARGKGVILWETPFGSRLAAKAALAQRGFRLVQVHGYRHGGSESRIGQNVIRKIHRRLAAGLYAEIIEMRPESLHMQRVVRCLKKNDVVCIQGFGTDGKRFASVTFLGIKQHFATGVVSLARMTGASLIPTICFYEPEVGNRMLLSEPLHLEEMKSGDDALVTAVTTYARLLESTIRKYPDQWGGWRDPPARAAWPRKILDAEARGAAGPHASTTEA